MKNFIKYTFVIDKDNEQSYPPQLSFNGKIPLLYKNQKLLNSGKTTQLPQYLYEAGYANDGKKIGWFYYYC